MVGMLAFKVIGMVGVASYTVGYACARIPHLSWTRQKLVAVPLDAIPDMPRGYSGRSLNLEALSQYRIDVGPDTQAERFAQGLECLGVFDRKGDLVGVTWIGRERHDEPVIGVRFILPSNAAWDGGLWIREDRRLTRAFIAAWALMKQWLQDEGLEMTMSSIADYNVASITSHQRLGSRTLGHVSALRIGALQITFGARPFLSWRTGGRLPELQLRPA